MSIDQKLDKIVDHFGFLEAKLAAGETTDIEALSREYAELKPVAEQVLAYRKTCAEIEDAKALLKDSNNDSDMRDLALTELEALRLNLNEIEAEIRVALLPKDTADARPAILEIRPGTGGEEAALFAADLMRMYHRYAEIRGWRFSVIDLQMTPIGGLRELVANIAGENVYARLKYESGVHRVQRVPATESGGRVHTSAATVAVLAEAEAVDIEILDSDIRIDTMRASGAGGQHVNTTDSAVRITHIPSGIVVTSSEKSQHRNREIAMQVLRARLYDSQRQKQQDARAAERKSQVGSGDRSERIRTYNFPQGRISEHRVNLTLYKLDDVMNGKLDEIIEALIADDQAAKMADLENATF